MFCTQCGKANNNNVHFCVYCGSAAPNLATAKPSPLLDEVSGFESNPSVFFEAAVGHSNLNYYLQRFDSFEQAGKVSASWHWPVFFISFFWFLYRKMWGTAVGYFFIFPLYLASLALIAYTSRPALRPALISLASALYLVGVFVLIPIYANAMYYRFCKKKIAAAQALTPTPHKQLSQIKTYGGVNIAAPIVLAVCAPLFVFFGMSILAAIAIPQYQAYVARATTVKALALSTQASRDVTAYYKAHQELPDTLQEAGFKQVIPKALKSIKLDAERAAIIVTFKKPLSIQGRTMVLQASESDAGEVTWQCSSDVLPKYLPSTCQ